MNPGMRYTAGMVRTAALVALLTLALLPALAHAGTPVIPGEAIEIGDVKTFAEQIAQTFITVAALTVVIFVIYGGIKMVMSQGDATKFGEGKKIVINAVIGGIVIFGVGIIIQTIAGFAQDPTSVFQ